MKVFISQPMNGRSEEEVMEEREKYIEAFKEWIYKHVATDDITRKACTFNVIDNYNKPYAPADASRLWYLADSLKLMADAEYVIFVPGWKKSYGCRVEMMCCTFYDIPYIKMKKC